MAATFVSSYCDVGGGNDDTQSFFDGFAFREFTPCVEDVVILGSVHVCFLLFGTLRLAQLLSPKLQESPFDRVNLRPASVWSHCVLLATNFVLFMIPLLQFNARLGASGVAGGMQLYPFEMWTYTLTAVAWAYSFILVALELKVGRFRAPGSSLFSILPSLLIFLPCFFTSLAQGGTCAQRKLDPAVFVAFFSGLRNHQVLLQLPAQQ
jgi:hypothetical protein